MIVTPAAEIEPNPGAAYYQKGVDYMLGRGVSADLGMAAASFLNAADTDEPRGLYAAGMMYLKGLGVAANAETANGLLQKSAAAGHVQARQVLDALHKGKDVSAFPIVVVDKPAARAAAAGAPVNRVTPTRVLAIVAAVMVVVVAGGGGGYWAWSSHRADTLAAAKAAEDARQAAALQAAEAAAKAQRLAAEAQAEKDKASAALREVEADKQRVAAQQAELAAQAEALRLSQEAKAAAPAAPVAAVAAAPAAPAAPVAAMVTAAGAATTDWPALLKAATPHLRTMMDAALANGADTVVRASGTVRALPQPARGDRKAARALNQEGLAALKREDSTRAIASLNAAMAADPSDEEIATNLGFALVRVGRFADAQQPLLRALVLNPGRSSAWYNLGQAYAGDNKEQAAYAAFLLTFQFAGNQHKSLEWFQRLAQDETASTTVQRLAKRLLGAPIVLAFAPNAAPQAAAPAALVAQPVAAQQAVAATAAPAAAKPLVVAAAPVTLQQFCDGKNNILSRSLCESRECKKPEHRGDPYCADFLKRAANKTTDPS